MLVFSFGAVRGTVEFGGAGGGAGDMDNYSVSLIGLGGSGVSDSRIP
jgi:hypothetical protein